MLFQVVVAEIKYKTEGRPSRMPKKRGLKLESAGLSGGGNTSPYNGQSYYYNTVSINSDTIEEAKEDDADDEEK